MGFGMVVWKLTASRAHALGERIKMRNQTFEDFLSDGEKILRRASLHLQRKSSKV
jgi:hypothetical protein